MFACCLKGKERLTTGHGQPVGNRLASLTLGPNGPILLQDVTYIDEMAHFGTVFLSFH